MLPLITVQACVTIRLTPLSIIDPFLCHLPLLLVTTRKPVSVFKKNIIFVIETGNQVSDTASDPWYW